MRSSEEPEMMQRVNLRAEEAPPEYRESFDIVTSRAVARLNVLAELCLPFVKLGGSFIAMKALDCEEERQEAQNEAPSRTCGVMTYPSRTPGAR